MVIEIWGGCWRWGGRDGRSGWGDGMGWGVGGGGAVAVSVVVGWGRVGGCGWVWDGLS